MVKSTISMAIFNSYVSHYQRVTISLDLLRSQTLVPVAWGPGNSDAGRWGQCSCCLKSHGLAAADLWRNPVLDRLDSDVESLQLFVERFFLSLNFFCRSFSWDDLWPSLTRFSLVFFAASHKSQRFLPCLRPRPKISQRISGRSWDNGTGSCGLWLGRCILIAVFKHGWEIHEDSMT